MSKCLLLLILVSLSSCSTKVPVSTPEPVLVVEEVKSNRKTTKTKQNLLHLFQIYDLAPFIFTKKIRIESMVVPHSHPILTLNSRYADEPYKLLAVFLHEQLHWWAASEQKAFDQGIKEMKNLFPQLPASAGTQVRNYYLHILICYLEYEALAHFIGKAETDKIHEEFIHKDRIYPWIYEQVKEKYTEIKKVVGTLGLAPAPLN